MNSKMSLSQKELEEWKVLILAAKRLGLTPAEVRDFFQSKKGDALKLIRPTPE